MKSDQVSRLLGKFINGIAQTPDSGRAGHANKKTAEDYNRLRGFALECEPDISSMAPPDAEINEKARASKETYGDLLSYAWQLQDLLDDE